MDNVELRRGEEQQGRAELLCKLACQVQRHAPKVGVAQQVIQVV
jgi:hypothetical protein